MDFFNNTIRKHIASVTQLDENFTFDQFKVGRSNITFKIEDGTLHQTATFRPKGLAGRLYWYSVAPFHWFIFNGMIDKISKP